MSAHQASLGELGKMWWVCLGAGTCWGLRIMNDWLGSDADWQPRVASVGFKRWVFDGWLLAKVMKIKSGRVLARGSQCVRTNVKQGQAGWGAAWIGETS